MKQELRHYEFVNSKTGNVIGYLSLPGNLDEKTLTKELEKKKMELAVANKLFIDLVYWQEEHHGVR